MIGKYGMKSLQSAPGNDDADYLVAAARTAAPMR
jgi:hypothetical protein